MPRLPSAASSVQDAIANLKSLFDNLPQLPSETHPETRDSLQLSSELTAVLQPHVSGFSFASSLPNAQIPALHALANTFARGSRTHLTNVVSDSIRKKLNEENKSALQPLRVLSTPNEARRRVLLSALYHRYATTDAHQISATHSTPQVIHLSQISRCNLDSETESGTTSLARWTCIVEGVATIAQISVASHEEVTNALQSALKNAVQTLCAPVLVVVHADTHDSLSAAASVVRALCDTYNVLLHVEGVALAMALRPQQHENQRVQQQTLLFDASEWASVSHSGVLDVCSWLSLSGCVLGWGFEDCRIEGEHLADVLVLWWCVTSVWSALGGQIDELCQLSGDVVDGLYTVPHVLNVHIDGAAECFVSVNIFGGEGSETAEDRVLFNRALAQYVGGCLFEPCETSVVTDNPELNARVSSLRFSPLLCALRKFPFCPLPKQGNAFEARISSADTICERLVIGARLCTLSKRGRAAFITRMRQSQDAEVVSVTGDHAPLYYGGIHVTPFGEVAQNGHWRRDDEMVRIVDKLTRAAANVNGSGEYTTWLWELAEVPVLCVGPGTAVTRADGEALPEYCGRLGEMIGDDEAVRVALSTAAAIIEIICGVLETGAVEERESEADGVIERSDIIEKGHGGEPMDAELIAEAAISAGSHDQKAAIELEEEKRPGEALITGPPNLPKVDDNDTADTWAPKPKAETITGVKQGEATMDQKAKNPGFWGLIFGDDPSSSEDDETKADNHRLDGKELEDDYFRV